MALRDRQISGIPLPKDQAFIVAIFMTALVPLIGYIFWYPLLGIPEELRPFLAIVGAAVHLGLSSGLVQPNTERAQLWFGSYTGISFPAGIYLNPRIPFPFILLFIRLIFGKEIYDKILWSLEGTVSVQSISIPTMAEGLTQDGVRVALSGTLVFEIVNAAVFLSQTRDDTDRDMLIAAVQAEYASLVKSQVIAKHDVQPFMQGSYQGEAAQVNAWITEACTFVKDFGLELARSPIVTIEIMSKHVERAFDRARGKQIFVEGSQSLAEAYAAFKEKLPAGTSEEVAVAMFNAEQIDNGQNPLHINVLKFK